MEVEPERLELRVASILIDDNRDDYTEDPQGVAVDLGHVDRLVAVVRPAGWEVTNQSPVLFRRMPLRCTEPQDQGTRR